MFKYFYITAWRNVSKNRLNTFINVLGLSVGVTVCLLIAFFVIYEKSWDTNNLKADRIYRLDEIQNFPGTPPQKVTFTMFPMGPAFKDEFAQVENFTRFFPAPQQLITSGAKRLINKRSFCADNAFFSLFDFPVISGNIRSALLNPNSAVLTESLAREIYGNTDVVGKTFLKGTALFKVTAVLKDVPENSHLQFDALFSISAEDLSANRNNWDSNFPATYILLKPNVDLQTFEKKFPDFIQHHINPAFIKNYSLYLQPLNKIHLGSSDMSHDEWNSKSFDGSYISVFLSLALIILVIAFVNFINLAIAASASRAKEIGVKKTIGASKLNIVIQFMSETGMITFFSFTLGLIFAIWATPLLNQITGRNIQFSYFNHFLNYIIFYGAALTLAILAGLYPSFYMASFRAIKVLKGKIFEPGQTFPVRNILATAQFTIAIILIIVTILVHNQVNFLRDRDPGFNKEQVLLIPASKEALDKKEYIENKLLNTPGVKSVSYSGQRLGSSFNQGYAKYETPNEGIKSGNMAFVRVDENYIPLYQLKVIKGRNFSKVGTADTEQGYIINEIMAKSLGWDDPIGKSFALGGTSTPLGKIIGVVKDFNFSSMKSKIEPLCFKFGSGYREISIRIKNGDARRTLDEIKATWNENIKDQPFEYLFLDDHFATLYRTEMQLSEITTVAASLAIFIACLGILGLISITIQQRIKEIGIRKLLGASISNILMILSKGVMKLVVLSSIIAFPISWWTVNNWLSDYAYRVSIHWWVFIIAGVAALLIALLTVVTKSLNVAVNTPVNNLRSE